MQIKVSGIAGGSPISEVVEWPNAVNVEPGVVVRFQSMGGHYEGTVGSVLVDVTPSAQTVVTVELNDLQHMHR